MDIGDVTPLYGKFKAMAIRMGIDEYHANDIVQEFYIRLMKIQSREGSLNRIEYNGQINWRYARKAIRNLIIDHFSQYSRMEMGGVPDEHVQPVSDVEIDVRHKLRELDSRANHVIFGEYYEKLFMTFVMEKFTYRGFHEATEISVSTIFYEMKYLKTELKKHLTNGTNST